MIFPPQGYKNISYKWLNQGMIFRPHGSYSVWCIPSYVRGRGMRVGVRFLIFIPSVYPCLTLSVYGIWISDKGWMISRHVFYLFTGYEFLTKDRWILKWVFYLFTRYEFLTKDGWILRYVFYLFTGYEFLTKDRWNLRWVFYLFMGYEFLTKDRWKLRWVFLSVYRAIYGVWISDER